MGGASSHKYMGQIPKIFRENLETLNYTGMEFVGVVSPTRAAPLAEYYIVEQVAKMIRNFFRKKIILFLAKVIAFSNSENTYNNFELESRLVENQL